MNRDEIIKSLKCMKPIQFYTLERFLEKNISVSLYRDTDFLSILDITLNYPENKVICIQYLKNIGVWIYGERVKPLPCLVHYAPLTKRKSIIKFVKTLHKLSFYHHSLNIDGMKIIKEYLRELKGCKKFSQIHQNYEEIKKGWNSEKQLYLCFK